MKCHSLRDAIVEQARGGVAGPGTAAAIESHLDHCASCAALMTRERQLSQGLRALAASTAADAPSDAARTAAAGAFAERQAAQAVGDDAGAASWRWAGAAAAALIVGASAAWWWSAVNESEVVNTEPAGCRGARDGRAADRGADARRRRRSAQAAGGGVRNASRAAPRLRSLFPSCAPRASSRFLERTGCQISRAGKSSGRRSR